MQQIHIKYNIVIPQKIKIIKKQRNASFSRELLFYASALLLVPRQQTDITFEQVNSGWKRIGGKKNIANENIMSDYT